MALTAVDGGPSYYGQFSNPLPTRADYFPVFVWGAYNLTTANLDRYKQLGINGFDWVADPSSASQLTNVRNAGMHVIHVSQEQARWTAKGTESVGYMLDDEMDMTCGPPGCDGYSQLRTILAGLPNDGRFRYNNWGKGIIFWENQADAARWLNGDAGGRYVDWSSVDVYWMTDNDSCAQSQGGVLLGLGRALTQAECKRASNYGAVIEKMRRLDGLDGRRAPVWNLIEVGSPMTGGSAGNAITAPQLRAAAWHSIIAGARGIVWFQHSFGGGPSGCITHFSLLDPCYQAQANMVQSVDAQIASLAPILNAPNVTSGWTASPTVKTAVKWYGGHFYVLAGSTANANSTGVFNLACVGNATAARLGEAGSVPVTGGIFQDSFADGNAVHIYRIDGGSACGLPPG